MRDPSRAIYFQRMIKRWYPEDDPITDEQIDVLLGLLAEVDLTDQGLEGFLIVCSRLVDESGNHRTDELRHIFQTDCSEGRRSLLQSLEYMCAWVGGMDAYLANYPVTIIPPKPAFPQFKIVGIENIQSYVYRVLDSNSSVHGTKERIEPFIMRTGKLPHVPRQTHPVRRTKRKWSHWCSYHAYDSPQETREALQILQDWGNDCQLRALIPTARIKRSAFVAFNGDLFDPRKFHKYFYEPLAQDHPVLPGGGIQIALDGAPPVQSLERWDASKGCWQQVWHSRR